MKQIFSDDMKKVAQSEANILGINIVGAVLTIVKCIGVSIFILFLIASTIIGLFSFISDIPNSSVSFVDGAKATITEIPNFLENLIPLFNLAITFINVFVTIVACATVNKIGDTNWKDIYIKEKRIRFIYKDAFDAYQATKEKEFVEFPQSSVFFKYYKDVFNISLDSLAEFNAALAQYMLSEQYDLYKYTLTNKKVGDVLSSMVNEDWLVMEKWFIYLCQSELKKQP